MTDFAALAAAARPTSDADYGSERQVAAENAFFTAVEAFLSRAAFQSLEDYCHKASPDERVDEALVAVDAQAARNAHLIKLACSKRLRKSVRS